MPELPEVEALAAHLREHAVGHQVARVDPASTSAFKTFDPPASGLRVHARTGLPCPICGDTMREVSLADRSFQYCPTCQTGGKLLADRGLSRLVR